MALPITIPIGPMRTGVTSSIIFRDPQVQEWVKLGVIEFSNGAVSYPRDFAIGAHIIVAASGHLGPVERAKAIMQIASAFRTAKDLITDLPRIAKTFWICFRYLTKNETTRCAGVNLALEGLKTDAVKKASFARASRLAGRFTGGQVVKFVLTGGPYGVAARTGPSGLGISIGFFSVVALGSIIRLNKHSKNAPTPLDTISAIMLGLSDGTRASEEAYRKIYGEIEKCVIIDVNRNEIADIERQVTSVIRDLRAIRSGEN